MTPATLERVKKARTASAPRPVVTKTIGPLLVATDASDSADAAIRAARAIATYTGQEVRVLAVHVPMPLMAPEVQLAMPPQTDAQGRVDLQGRVRDQLSRLANDVQWKVQVVSGDPAAFIANTAKSIGASMVIMGLGGHGVFERIFGDELVLKVLRLGTVPVLAVAPTFTGLPKNVLVAVDFSSSCVRALSLAAPLMRANAKVTLTHVISPDLDAANWSGSDAGYHGSVGRALDRVVAEMGFGDAALVQRKIVAGDPGKELVKLTREIIPDLIVTGSHGHNFLSRLLLGSVSTKLIRHAQCSILVAPPVEGQEFMDELPQVSTQFSFYEWAERLEDFTRRNSGRRATMEIVDPELGAQVQEKNAVFVGAAFDPRDARLQIMFGNGASGEGGHLTRSIPAVTAVQMLRDRAGKDLLLRVAHGRGQTLLTLER